MDNVKLASPDFCPYVGLQPYNEEYQDYFFGRERDSRIISSNLYAAPLTILYGASGVGKSSVLRAGVTPRLRSAPRTAVVIFEEWTDRTPLNTLKARCLEAIAATPEGRNVQGDLSLPLDDFLLAAAQAFGGTLVIILDQFEEYFLYHPETEKDNTFDAEFARTVNRVEIDANFLISLREDAVSRLDRFRPRIPNMLSNALRLRHLDAASARDAIRKPLEVYGRNYPDEPRISVEEELVEELIQEVQVEKLMIGQSGQGVFEVADAADSDVRIEAPFLQLVLTRLWAEEIRHLKSHVIRLETLHALGGAGRIVRTHMDEAMNALSPEEQETAGSIFRYLVTPSGTKIAYTIADLEYYAKPGRPLQPVLEKLAQGNVRIMRTVTLPAESGIVRYEIYHDVLAPAVLDWRARYENGKQMLNLFYLLIEKGDMNRALQVYQEMVQQTPQQAFLPERYQFRKILGQSELGVSYLVSDQEGHRFVTATILHDTLAIKGADLTRFARQVQALSSPRISRFFGFDRYHEHTYMLNEYVDADPLRKRLKPGQPLPYLEAMQIAGQIAEALEDGHQQGVPHLNLRPSNIVLGPEGVKLVSYGFSRLTLSERIADTVESDKSYDYLSPEQLDGAEGDERSDIYALGTILYELLTGHTPGLGSFQYPSETNVEATEAVDVLIDHARQRNPDRRFATAREMRAEINRISQVSLEGSPNQYLRVILAWVSQRYEQLVSRKWLSFLLAGLITLFSLSLIPSIPKPLSLLARISAPLLLNSLLISIPFDWVVRTIARRRGLGSLITTAGGMGAILGLVFTLNLLRLMKFEIIPTLDTATLIIDFAGMLIIVLFETALSLGIMLVAARIVERTFKSYTSGFYWSFIAIVLLELVLTLQGQPFGLFSA